MTQVFSDMLYLFTCAAHGVQPEKKPDMDLDGIYHKAASQGVLPLVLTSFKELYMDDGAIICGTSLEYHIKRLRMQALLNIQRGHIIHNAIKQLADNGISCCVLKGDTVAGLYKNPECRISGDTDIYVGEDDKTISKSIKIFEENGFEFSGDPPNSHHFRAYHETAGLLELHRSLYKELFIDVWFDNKTSLSEPFRTVYSPTGCEIPALGVNDGLMYIYLHMVKHFLRGGIGIRPLMDVLFYVRNYKSEIDFKRFHELIRHLKYDKFFYAIIFIGVKYLGFTADDLYYLPSDESTAEKLLSDMENSGLFGQDEEWRSSFKDVYNEQRFNRFKTEDYTEYMSAWKKESLFKKFFMNRVRIKTMYPYVARHSFFLPIAWLHRAYLYVRKLFNKRKNHLAHTDLLRMRLDLIRELDMI